MAKRIKPTSVKKIKIPDSMGVKFLRENITPIVNDTAKSKKTRKILSRSKHIANLGPPGSLPTGREVSIVHSISDLSNGKISPIAAISRGGCMIVRDGVDVAVLYRPDISDTERLQGLQDRIDDLLDKLEEIEVVKERLKRLAELGERSNKYLRRCIDLMRTNGESEAAEKFELEFRKLNDGQNKMI